MSSSSTTTATTTASAADPKRPQRKLCSHTLTGGCKFGDACPNEHPSDLEEAKRAYALMPTRSLNLCGFYPNCTRPGCTFLHASVLARTAPPASQAASPAARAPPGRTPATRAGDAKPRAAEAKRRAGDAKPRAGDAKRRGDPKPAQAGKGRAGRGAPQASAARSEPEAFRVLHKIRGKVNALEKKRLTSAAFAAEFASDDAERIAGQAQKMQEEILRALLSLGDQIDGYLLELGATADVSEETLSEESLAGDDSARLSGDSA